MNFFFFVKCNKSNFYQFFSMGFLIDIYLNAPFRKKRPPTWSTSEVCAWIFFFCANFQISAAVAVSIAAPEVFRKNEVDGFTLKVGITSEDLADMGIKSIGLRKRIQRVIYLLLTDGYSSWNLVEILKVVEEDLLKYYSSPVYAEKAVKSRLQKYLTPLSIPVNALPNSPSPLPLFSQSHDLLSGSSRALLTVDQHQGNKVGSNTSTI